MNDICSKCTSNYKLCLECEISKIYNQTSNNKDNLTLLMYGIQYLISESEKQKHQNQHQNEILKQQNEILKQQNQFLQQQNQLLLQRIEILKFKI